MANFKFNLNVTPEQLAAAEAVMQALASEMRNQMEGDVTNVEHRELSEMRNVTFRAMGFLGRCEPATKTTA